MHSKVYAPGQNLSSPQADTGPEPAQNPAPSIPNVERPSGWTKCPKRLRRWLNAMGRPLSAAATELLLYLADHSNLCDDQRELVFVGMDTMAAEFAVDVRTIRRWVAAIKCSGLVVIYGTRHKSTGRRSTNYYDLTAYFQLCGESLRPHTNLSKRLSKDGLVVRKTAAEIAEEKAQRMAAKQAAAEKREIERPSRQRASASSGDGVDSHRGGATTTGQKSPDNNNQRSVCLKNNKNSQARKQHEEAVGALSVEKQFVYWRLIELGYGKSKALHDLKKYSAAYVEARIDFVTRDAKGINHPPSLLNYWMSKDVGKAYKFQATVQGKVASNQGNVAPSPALSSDPAPSPSPVFPAPAGRAPTSDSGMASLGEAFLPLSLVQTVPDNSEPAKRVQSEPSKTVNRAGIWAQVLNQVEQCPKDVFAKARTNVIRNAQKDNAMSEIQAINLPLREMRLVLLVRLRDECVKVAREIEQASG